MSVEITPVLGRSGYFRVYVTPPGGARKDVTFFRSAPTQISSWSSTDPFGDAVASLSFPAITIRDRPGSGDLDWLVPWSDIDITHFWEDGTPSGWSWEGFIASEEISAEGLGISCKGALFQADNFLAYPAFPQRPVPYEELIRAQLDPATHPSLRTAPMVLEWPEGWNTVVPDPGVSLASDPQWYLRPWGVLPGDRWTGLTSRTTGAWEPGLTSFIQTLLSVMYTDDGGQWTLRKRHGRVPVLQVRPALRYATEATLQVYAAGHGVDMSFSRDFTQSANVIFGSGSDFAGTAFSGQNVTGDGATTYYEPFAALPYVYPASGANPRYLPSVARKESMLQFQQGLDETSARDVAAVQLRKFADPGYTGSITLSADPIQDGVPFSRFLITAGMSILVRGLRGTDVLFHISECSVSLEQGSVSLTVDTKFRDALTVAEVRARTKDALDPVRLLQPGKYSSTVQDLILPWSYSQGSGVIPSGGDQDATEFFTQIVPNTARFPYTDWTTKYPPKQYPKYYVRLEPKQTNATLNWSGLLRDGLAAAAIPVRASQAGSIRLTQIAAYDENGNVFPCRFHVGLYTNSSISSYDMPALPADYNGYAAGQNYPFFPAAFEQINPDGTETSEGGVLISEGSELVVAWGNYYEPAGYSPGLYSTGGAKTGMLIDEAPWSFDTSGVADFDKQSIENTRTNSSAGLLYILIYCDDQLDKPVYFQGRLFRQEPGVS